MDAIANMQTRRQWLLVAVVTWLASTGWTNAQTTESVRLYGTFIANRNYPFDGPYTSSSSSSSGPGRNVTSRDQDTIYWERTRDQMRSQYAANTDRYSPNWGANDRVDSSRSQSGPGFSSSSSSSSYNPTGSSYNNNNYNNNNPTSYDARSRNNNNGPPLYDNRNQNYQPDYNSKVPSFASGSYNQNSGVSSSSGSSSSSSGSGGSISGRDRPVQNDWDRLQERERERERERQREIERERNFYLNGRNRGVIRPGSTNSGSGIRTQLPGCGVFDEWRPDLMGTCRPDFAANIIDKDVSVTTPYGRIRGFFVHLFDGPGVALGDRPGPNHYRKLWRTVSTFLGIPYATPPVNEGRFKPPRAKRAWSIWDAVDFGPACPQPIQYVGATKGVRYMNEDCLYLNIFTPTTGAVAEKFPVVFYIHGGEFEHGASNTFPGHMLAAVGDVVVVTVNYRLGALGFLSTGNEYSPGNYGMLDLSMALKWVYDNIYAFNGNKDLITVYGPGSGASAAGLLAIAPDTKHMVKQIFGQSGSPLSDSAAISDLFRMQNTSRVYADRVGCIVDKSYRLLECLRSRSYEELGNVRFTPGVGTWPWAPVVDREIRKPPSNWYEGWEEKDWSFLPDVPEELIRMRHFNPALRYLAGVTADEAAYIVYQNKSLLPNFEITEAFFDMKVREYIHRYNYTYNPDGVFRAIKYMYTYWPDPRNTTHIRQQLINFWSDALYKSPSDKMIKMMVDNDVPTYSYVLNTTINALNYPFWSRVPHNIEYFFLTGAPFMDPDFFPEDKRVQRNQWNEDDRRMSEFFMKSLANFARYGRPTPVAIYNINWPEMRHGWLQYLNLNRTDNSTLEFNYRQQECAFWFEYMPSVVGFLLPTYRPFTEYWWEPNTPISVAFWSVSGVCAIFIIMATLCCCLWRGAKRANRKLLAENYLSQELTENLHTGSKEFSDGSYTSDKLKASSVPSTLV